MRHTRRSPVTALAAVTAIAIFALGCASTSEVERPRHARAMVEEMLAGRRTQSLIEPLTSTHGELTLAQAYVVQRLLVAQLTKDLGGIAGYKVAYASKAAQEQFGVSEPASGPLLQLQRLSSGSTVARRDFRSLLLETEIAFTIGSRIDRRLKSVEELKPLVRYVHVGFDLGENRFDSARAKPVAANQIANGIGAHRFVIGPAHDPAKVDVDALTLRLLVNGTVVAESPTRNVLGSPWNSLLWLASQLAARGDALQPGDVVLTGTAAPAYRAEAGQIPGVYEGDGGPLGKVTLRIE